MKITVEYDESDTPGMIIADFAAELYKQQSPNESLTNSHFIIMLADALSFGIYGILITGNGNPKQERLMLKKTCVLVKQKVKDALRHARGKNGKPRIAP